MAWHRVMLVAAAAVAVLSGDTRAQACPDGQFSVSILDNPQVQCLSSRPCSGVYGPQGLLTGVGACPSGNGCALLPHNPTVMGCVVAGRADVSYVNPDGSLTRGGVVISGPPTTTTTTTETTTTNNNANSNAGSTTAAPAATPSSAETSTGNSTNAATTTSPTPTTNVPTPAHVKPDDAAGTSDDGSATKAPTATPSASSGKPSTETATGSSSSSGATESSVTTTSPTSSSTPQANQQNALDDISGDVASNSNRDSAGGAVSLGSIIAIVVGCLAVVAVIAGVFVLRKKKEQSAQTPVGGAGDVDDYGAACVTPKEHVLLL